MKTQRSQNKLTNLKKKSGYVYTEDEMVGWHHRLNGHEFEQALGNGERQGSLVCCSSWGCKELDTTERLNNNKPWESYAMSLLLSFPVCKTRLIQAPTAKGCHAD